MRRTGLGLVRVMRFRKRLLRRQQHHHLPAFHSRKRFDDGVRLQVVTDPLEEPDTELLVRHLAAAETQRDLRLVAFAEKSDQVAKLDLVVAFVGPRPELHFLDLNLLQLELRFVLLFRLTVLELAEVHDPAHRRLCRRRNFHQIEFGRFCFRDGVGQAYDPKLLTFDPHETNFGGRDLTIDPLLLFQGQCRFSYTDKKRPCPAASSRRRASKASRDILPRSSPPRVRTATELASSSLSPTINWYGNFCRLCSRIL